MLLIGREVHSADRAYVDTEAPSDITLAANLV